jgi:superoxide dismutase
MNISGMKSFLSEANIKEHLSYHRTLKNKYSIIEKSYPQLKGKCIEQLLKLNVKRQIKNEAFELLCKIRAHEIYFSSFSAEVKPSPLIRKHYFSENSFVYEMKMAALSREYGYLYVYSDFKGVPRFRCVREMGEVFIKDRPKLLVDLYEHAYFADYGFNYPLYLDGALSHLDLSLIT